jgi:hypothetical protein
MLVPPWTQAQFFRVVAFQQSPIIFHNDSNPTGIALEVWNNVVDILNTNFSRNVNASFLFVDSLAEMTNMLITGQAGTPPLLLILPSISSSPFIFPSSLLNSCIIDIGISGIVPSPNVFSVLNTSVPYFGTVLQAFAKGYACIFFFFIFSSLFLTYFFFPF